MRRAILYFFIFVLLAAGVTYALAFRPYQGFSNEGVYVDIPRGASQRTISRLLAENGVVRSRTAFETIGRLRGRRLQAGEYYFNHAVSALEVLDTLANGRVYVREFVVPEGFTMFDIATLAENEGLVGREEFLAAARDPALIRDLAPDVLSLEGFLFPATYEFPRHMTGKNMTAAMVKRFRQLWLTLPKGDVGTAQRSISDVVTLASLVERETPRPEERPHVAGVFTNRLRIGQPLQCDPTVVYALVLAGKYSGKLQGADLHFFSPYNTYQNRGLPPGPIANPGEAALRAAINPPATEDLYFVANTEGGHFFSKTLEEHNQNVARYRRLLDHSRETNSESGASDSAAKRGGQ